jgi:hypothetical protein
MDSINKRINKKGILLTLGLIFVSLTILSFAGIILKNSEDSESRIKEFAETERFYNLEMSVSKSIHKMRKSLGENLLDIDLDHDEITINTTFSNKSLKAEYEISNQLKIFSDRLNKSSYIDFKGNLPFFSEGESLFDDSPLNSSRFYLNYDSNIYVEYFSYPYNTIYLNGFNYSNLEKINLSIYSSDSLPKNLENIGSSCVEDCILLEVNTYLNGVLQNSTLVSFYGYGFPVGNLGVYSQLYRLNLSSFSNSINNSIAFNWLNLTGGGTYSEGTSEGLAIILPDTTSTNSFDIFYYGHDYTDKLEGDIKLNLVLKMKGEHANYVDYLVSSPIFDINMPFIDTKADNLRVKYFD